MEGPSAGDDLFFLTGTARFKVIRKIGSGAMGTVYEAIDPQQGVRVAIKTLNVDDPEHLLRLKREFRSVQDISSPHLVRYNELVEDRGRWFFTMDLIEGASFLEYVWWLDAERDSAALASRPTVIAGSPARVAFHDGLSTATPGVRYHEPRLRSALIQLGRGLSTLHSHGMVHRDIKPSNVLVT